MSDEPVFDPVALEVFRHRVTAVAESMGASLQRAAYSPNIKERLDFSCAVFDASGNLLAQAAHIPVHLGAMPEAVAAACDHIGQWQRGDVVILNDPYLGGSHLPDITAVSPVFAPGSAQPGALIASRAHHADVGGATPGSLPLARDLFGEGLVVPPVRLVRGGTLDGDILEVLCANSRTPAERRGDMQAQLAAHYTGTERLEEILGADEDAFRQAAAALLTYTERKARSQLRALPEGSSTFTDAIESAGRPLEIRATVSIHGSSLHVDFAGTAAQTTGGVNAPLAVTRSAVYYVMACLLHDVPINAGTFAPVSIAAPRGSLVNPERPAPVAAGNVETSQRIVDVVLGALAGIAPDIAPGASQGTMNNVIVGGRDPDSGRSFTYYETIGGGCGASPTGPGASAVQVHMTNTRNTPVEALESAYPLRVTRYAVRRGSGGVGLHRGGDGIVRTLEFLTRVTLTLVTERRETRPWGAAGGGPGKSGRNELESGDQTRTLPAKVVLDVLPGDRLTVRTPGGGGWGAAAQNDERTSRASR